MRRNSRKNHSKTRMFSDRILIYSSITVALIALILIGIFIYSKNLNKNVKKGTMSLEQMANIAKNDDKDNEETESTSTDIGKKVNEVNTTDNTTLNANASSNTTSNTNTNSNTSANTTSNTTKKTNTTSNSKTNTATKTNTTTTQKSESAKKELSFGNPVDGEVVKAFARDNLVYSNTLEEWVTHLGIDIKADKTTVVKSAEEGTVKSIKNDPRYGLTIVIEHENGFQTVYANLLSSEFVVEGEKVKKGQTIGTVGNTATFESVDEPHLHFEILKDSVQQDPSIYLK